MHAWQDWVLSIGFILFSIALIPSVRSKDKPALSTSVLTASVLTSAIVCYITLGLWFSASATVLNCGLWTMLAIQQYRIQKTANKKSQTN